MQRYGGALGVRDSGVVHCEQKPPMTLVFDLLRLMHQQVPGIGWIATFEHFEKDRVRVAFATR